MKSLSNHDYKLAPTLLINYYKFFAYNTPYPSSLSYKSLSSLLFSSSSSSSSSSFFDGADFSSATYEYFIQNYKLFFSPKNLCSFVLPFDMSKKVSSSLLSISSSHSSTFSNSTSKKYVHFNNFKLAQAYFLDSSSW